MGIAIGPLHVRRSAYIDASPARVWQEFTSFERIRTWLGLGHEVHRFEPALDGEVLFGAEIDGERQLFGGTVVVFEPAREITCTSQWEGALAWPVPTLWTFRLTAVYDGTLVEIFHHGFERLGRVAADALQGYEQGWTNRHLTALRKQVEGGA